MNVPLTEQWLNVWLCSLLYPLSFYFVSVLYPLSTPFLRLPPRLSCVAAGYHVRLVKSRLSHIAGVGARWKCC